MDAFDGLAIAGALAIVDLLGAGRCDAGEVALGEEARGGDQRVVVLIRRLPFECELLLAGVVEVFEEEGVVAGGEVDGLAGLGGCAVAAVVVEDHLAVEREARAVIAGEAEGVLALVGDDDPAGDFGDEGGGNVAEVGIGAEVDGGADLIGVGGLVRDKFGDLGEVGIDFVDADGDAGVEFVGGLLGGRLLKCEEGGQKEECLQDCDHRIGLIGLFAGKVGTASGGGVYRRPEGEVSWPWHGLPTVAVGQDRQQRRADDSSVIYQGDGNACTGGRSKAVSVSVSTRAQLEPVSERRSERFEA